jgi:hypothetical protein
MNKPETPVCNLGSYHQNRQKFPPEELSKYAGQYVAFSFDGKQILASGKNEDEVEARSQAAGIDPSQVVGSYVPSADQSILL